MRYFPTEEELKKAGAIQPHHLDWNLKETTGTGVLNPNDIARARISGHTMMFDRIGSNGNDLKTGMTDFKLSHPADEISAGSLQVYKNGVSLEQTKDYLYSVHHPTKQASVVLRQSIIPVDDDVEIRYKLTNASIMISDVLLLPRYEFDDETLGRLIPDPGDLFEVSKLIQFGNQNLLGFEGRKCTAVQLTITKLGIVGTVQMRN